MLIHMEIDAHEFLLADDGSGGNPLHPLLDVAFEKRQLIGIDDEIKVGIKENPLLFQHMSQEELGVQPGRLDVMIFKILGGPGEKPSDIPYLISGHLPRLPSCV